MMRVLKIAPNEAFFGGVRIYLLGIPATTRLQLLSICRGGFFFSFIPFVLSLIYLVPFFFISVTFNFPFPPFPPSFRPVIFHLWSCSFILTPSTALQFSLWLSFVWSFVRQYSAYTLSFCFNQFNLFFFFSLYVSDFLSVLFFLKSFVFLLPFFLSWCESIFTPVFFFVLVALTSLLSLSILQFFFLSYYLSTLAHFHPTFNPFLRGLDMREI